MPTPKTKKPKPSKAPADNREVLHPALDVEICSGAAAIGEERAKQILGWEVLPSRDGALFTDVDGSWIRCTNNLQNRPFTESWARQLAQDMLNGNWAPDGPNGENIVIGRYGSVISGQHRLIGLVLANQIARKQELKYKRIWPAGVFIDSLVVFGVSESERNIRTIDNVKPRTLADVLMTGPYFGELKGSDRRAVCRMMDYAIRQLWGRTGVEDAHAVYRTHSESINFLARHDRLKRAVKHIFEENKEGAIAKYLSPGYASALLYLMGTSGSDGNAYRNLDVREESGLSFDFWDKAETFWTLLAGESPEFKDLRYARRPQLGTAKGEEYTGYCFAEGEDSGSVHERMGVLAKAWNVFVQGKKIQIDDRPLKYRMEYDDGDNLLSFFLLEYPDVEGIDLGDPRGREEEEAATESEDGASEPELAENDPTPEEIAERALAERKAAEEVRARKEQDREMLRAAAEARRKNKSAAPNSRLVGPLPSEIRTEVVEPPEEVMVEVVEESNGEATPEPNGEPDELPSVPSKPARKPRAKPIARKV